MILGGSIVLLSCYCGEAAFLTSLGSTTLPTALDLRRIGSRVLLSSTVVSGVLHLHFHISFAWQSGRCMRSYIGSTGHPNTAWRPVPVLSDERLVLALGSTNSAHAGARTAVLLDVPTYIAPPHVVARNVMEI